MCGIALTVGLEHLHADHPALEIIKHRGPDDKGTANFNACGLNIGMGHRRLSIIDLSEKGHQPMLSADKRFAIIFNGEIYNYREIRTELEKDGIEFVSDSDTEVLLAAYAKWGADSLKQLNGMFAFAVFDKQRDTIFLARDRFGIKPLYYHNSEKGLVVCSEIKQLTCFEHFTPKIDNEKLYHFLNSGDFDFDEKNLWADVRMLPPGYFSEINLNSWRPGTPFKQQEWYSPNFDDTLDITFDEATVEFRKLLDRAVALRLRADVPVGFLLSGGLDSSTLVALAHNTPAYEKTSLRTYSTCYGDPDYDEKEYIDAVVENTQADACFHYPGPEDMEKHLNKVIWHNDLPILPGSPCSHWLLYQHIKNENDNRKVVLEGQGADEILCGYGDFHWAALFEKLSPTRVFSFPFNLMAHLKKHPQPPHIVLRKFRRMATKESLRFPTHPALNSPNLLLGQPTPNIAIPRESTSVKKLHRHRLVILRYILHYVDRDSMAHSRETRVPFLDHDLVDFCLALPTKWKISNGISKRVMREAVKDVLPEKVKNRTDKKGYSSPTMKWIKNELNPMMTSEIEKCRDLPFVNPDALKITWESSVKRDSWSDPILWRLMATRRWLEIFGIKT